MLRIVLASLLFASIASAQTAPEFFGSSADTTARTDATQAISDAAAAQSDATTALARPVHIIEFISDEALSTIAATTDCMRRDWYAAQSCTSANFAPSLQSSLGANANTGAYYPRSGEARIFCFGVDGATAWPDGDTDSLTYELVTYLPAEDLTSAGTVGAVASSATSSITESTVDAGVTSSWVSYTLSAGQFLLVRAATVTDANSNARFDGKCQIQTR